MLDFPGAVVDQYGVVHAFFRGASNALWQAANTSGGWELTNLSSVTAGRKIQGSPSASLLDGSVVVHARTAQGLAVFRGDDRWSMQEFAAAFVGSPTSTRGAAHARSMNQDLWLFATSWVWRGGPPE